MHQHVRKRVLFCLFALFAVPLSMSVYGQTSYSVVFSNNASFVNKVEVPMVAALYRNDKDVNTTHTKDNSRWQISLKYDDPRWKAINDGTVYWYIKVSGGGHHRPEHQWGEYGRWQRLQCYDCLCLCPWPHAL